MAQLNLWFRQKFFENIGKAYVTNSVGQFQF